MNFLKKLTRITIKTLDFGAKYVIMILLGWVLMSTAMWHGKYTSHYADAIDAREREVTAAQLASYLASQRAVQLYEQQMTVMTHEHDRQMIAARMIQSQEDWVKQCEYMREAYMEEKAKRMQAKRDFYRTAQEMYHLIRTLEYEYPEVYDEAVPDVMKKLPQELQDALRRFPDDQVRPCEPKPPEPTEV